MSADAYEDVGPLDSQVIEVAWRDPDVLRPVAAGTFETSEGAPLHGVTFTDERTGFREDGTADDVFGLVWIADNGERQTSYLPNRGRRLP
jgi:hypothetical protein